MSVVAKLKEKKWPMFMAVAAVGITFFMTRNGKLLKKEGPRTQKAAPVIDAEYAGYREKISDFPDRSKKG